MRIQLSAFTITLLLAFAVCACDEQKDSDSSSQTLKVTTTSLPNTFNGLTYNHPLGAQFGTQPYTWSITSGALPNGLSLDPNSGVISGVANDQEGWNYYFTVQVEDANNNTGTADLSIFIDGIVVPFEG